MKLNKGARHCPSGSNSRRLARGLQTAQTDLRTIPRKEVAAYRLNRLLGLDAVPPPRRAW